MQTPAGSVAMSRDGNPVPLHPPVSSYPDPTCKAYPEHQSSDQQSLGASSAASTMDLPTQDVTDGYFVDSEEEDHSTEAWGRLFPLADSFVALGKLCFLIFLDAAIWRTSIDRSQYSLNVAWVCLATLGLDLDTFDRMLELDHYQYHLYFDYHFPPVLQLQNFNLFKNNIVCLNIV